MITNNHEQKRWVSRILFKINYKTILISNKPLKFNKCKYLLPTFNNYLKS